jgi:drug/metabolite transporter, DME family
LNNSGATLSVASSGMLYGLVTVGGSLLSKHGFSVLDISFFYMFYSIIFLAPFAIKKDPRIFSKIRSAWKYLLVYAIVNLVILLMQFESLALGLSPPTVALLLYTQPAWTIIFGRVIFGEKITFTRLGIIALALFGVLLVTNPFSLHTLIGPNYSIG